MRSEKISARAAGREIEKAVEQLNAILSEIEHRFGECGYDGKAIEKAGEKTRQAVASYHRAINLNTFRTDETAKESQNAK
jgi:hypothetical protein